MDGKFLQHSNVRTYLTALSCLGGLLTDTYQDICSVGLPPHLHPETFSFLTHKIKFEAVDALPDIQRNLTTSFSSPIPSEDPVAIHCSTQIMLIIPPRFCDGDYVTISLNALVSQVCFWILLPSSVTLKTYVLSSQGSPDHIRHTSLKAICYIHSANY